MNNTSLNSLIYASIFASSSLFATSVQALDNSSLKPPLRTANEYIVTFKPQASPQQINRITQNIRSRQNIKQFSLISGFVGQLSQQTVNELQTNPAVLAIEANRAINLDKVKTFPSLMFRNSAVDSWGIDRIDQASLPLDNSYSPSYQGVDVHAYILDTGINTNHVEFSGRADSVFVASDISEGAQDQNGHGTHMAAIVGGTEWGVAKQVNLHSVKVLDSSGQGTLAGLIEGIEYITNNHQAPAVATLGFNTSYSTSLNNAISASIAAGVTYAVPSGDYSQDACQFSPGAVENTITVAATWNDDRASAYSNHGDCVDIMAPGLYVKSAWHITDSANNSISHSPVSAAFVAGAAALVLEYNANLSPTGVKNQIINNAVADELTQVPQQSPNLLLNVTTVDTPPATTKTGENGNIALVGTNGLTSDSYTASYTRWPSSDQPVGAFDGYFISGNQMNDDAGSPYGRGIWYGYGLDQWIQVDFGREVSLTGFAEYHDTAPDHHIPEGCIIQVSDDGINFTDHEAFSNSLFRSTRSYQFTTPAVGRYIRYVSTDRHDYYFNMGELEYYGDFTGN